jgi:hypothetical protein
MFTKKIRFDYLKDNPKIVSDMNDGDVIQITNGGDTFKVMMTQEYHFKLIARLEKAEKASKRTNYDPDILMNKFEGKLTSLKT